MFDVSEGSRVLAYWYGEARESPEYGNEVHVLRGHCEKDGRYLLERDSEGEAWLTLDRGIPVEYHFVAYTQRVPRALLFRMQLSLHQVARTPEIAKRLHIDRD